MIQNAITQPAKAVPLKRSASRATISALKPSENAPEISIGLTSLNQVVSFPTRSVDRYQVGTRTESLTRRTTYQRMEHRLIPSPSLTVCELMVVAYLLTQRQALQSIICCYQAVRFHEKPNQITANTN